MNVIAALIYLRIVSFQNALLSRIKRLRQPKYLIGAIFGGAYVYFALLRRLRMGRSVDPSGLTDAFPLERLPLIASIAAAVLMILAVICWAWPRPRASLAFTEAEIAFLFPAPASRTALLNLSLITTQLRLLFPALIIAVVSSPWNFILGNLPMRIVGWWIIFATAALHVTGSSFAITRLLDRGVSSLRRQLAMIGVVVVTVVVVALMIWRDLHGPQRDDLIDTSTVFRYLATELDTGPLRWLLLPARWIVQPLLAPDPRSFVVALGAALIVFAAHYLWVLLAAVSFEEASLERSKKRVAMLAAMRDGKLHFSRPPSKARRSPFNLAAVRSVELAFLWKNLSSAAGYLRPRPLLIAAAVIAVGCSWLMRNQNHEVLRTVVTIISPILGVYVLVLGPLLARHDLRTDIRNVDVLKAYPLHGRQIVLGEILTPIAIVSALFWLALLATSLTFEPRKMPWFTPTIHVGITIGIALLAPLLCAVEVLLLNAASILFPAWTQTRQAGTAGIEVMGQQLFLFAALLFVMVAALLPAVLVAGVIYLIAHWLVGVLLATVLAAIIVLLVLASEISLGIFWLGERFERFDLSAELRA